MPKRLKLSLWDRAHAFVLMRRGVSISDSVNRLTARHPGFSKAQIAKAYFPSSGAWRMPRGFENPNLSPEERRELITTAWRKSARISIARTARNYSLHNNPIFAARRDERAARLFRALHKDPDVVARRERARLATLRRRMAEDPVFAEKKRSGARDTIDVLNQQPAFRATVFEGIQDYWREERKRRSRMRALRSIDAEAHASTVFEGGGPVPLSSSTPAADLLNEARSRALVSALKKLSPDEQTAISDFLNGGSPNQISLASALSKLRRKRALRGFVD